MRKINRIIMISVSVLLSLVLITSSVLSGTFAKYVTGEKSVSSNTGTVASWGITVDVGDHLEKQYSNSESKIVVNTIGTTDVIAPGTSGSLAWFRVSGNPEVAFDIDLSGNIDIGMGFWSLQDVIDHTRDTMYSAFVGMTEAEKIEKIKKDQETEIVEAIKTALGNDKFDTLTEDQLEQKKNERAKTILFEMEQNVLLSNIVREKKEILLYDQDGKEIEYFPIIIDCVEYDMLNDEQMVERGRTCLTRTTLVKDQQGNVVLDDNENELKDTHKYFGEHAFDSVTDMISALNGNDSEWALSRVLDDQDNVPNQQIDKVYAIEWHWPYSNTSDYPGKGSGSAGTYQTKELDGQLGEAVLKKSDLFGITLNMSATVEQIGAYSYTRNENSVQFGSYPQTLISSQNNAQLLATLNGLGDSATWEILKNGKYYADVVVNGERYRGVSSDASGGSPSWFKWEPISWTIEEQSNGEAFLLCDKIIDSSAYLSSNISTVEGKKYNASTGVPEGTFANNYRYSDIRNYLTGAFCETAFNEQQINRMQMMWVDNSAQSSGSQGDEQFACEDTRDNIFLLSATQTNEIANPTKIATDYVKHVEGNDFNLWSTRSPSNSGSNGYNVINAYPTGNSTVETRVGIVPALRIKL